MRPLSCLPRIKGCVTSFAGLPVVQSTSERQCLHWAPHLRDINNLEVLSVGCRLENGPPFGKFSQKNIALGETLAWPVRLVKSTLEMNYVEDLTARWLSKR